MHPRIKAEHDRKQVERKALQAQLSEHQAKYDNVRAEFAALREKAKTEEPGYWHEGTYAPRLWELNGEIERLAAHGLRLQDELQRTWQAERDVLKVNGLINYTAARLR